MKLPATLQDLIGPLLPFLIHAEMSTDMHNHTVINRLEFYFPKGFIQYDPQMMMYFCENIEIEIDWTEPVFSRSNSYIPVIDRKRRGEKVICHLKNIFHFSTNEHTTTKKQTGTTERSKESTNEPSENTKRKLSFPPQRFA